MENLIKYINDNNLGNYKENYSFKALTTYKTGGNARLVVFPNDVSCLKKIIIFIKKNNISYKIFGNGSNILASDNDYNGIIIKLTNMRRFLLRFNYLFIDAGASLMGISNTVCKMGLSGLEFASGIPGTVGGAIYMNAGAYLKDISNILVYAKVLDLNDMKVKIFFNRKFNFKYRSSILQTNKNYIVLEGVFKLKKGNKDKIMNLVVDRKQRRVETQPLEYPSAGSVFRNPLDNYAGKLIEDCKLKGKRIGGAEISLKHANFIINKDNASSKDIKELMDLAHDTVKDKFDIDLKKEQELFNWE